jgi:hypothetical protein
MYPLRLIKFYFRTAERKRLPDIDNENTNMSNAVGTINMMSFPPASQET